MNLTKLDKNKVQGFTLIEAIVSLALFAIAFSGLYLLFGMATLANSNTEKRMYLNQISFLLQKIVQNLLKKLKKN